MDKLWFDFRFGMRNLIRYPKYTVIVLLTMMLGIATATTMFSLINQVIFQPLPLPKAEELVSVRGYDVNTGDPVGFQDVDYATYKAWTDLKQKGLTLAFMVLESSVLTDLDTPLYATSLMMSPSLLPLLNVQPLLGRWFHEEEAGKNVVILTHDLWVQEYASDNNIIGDSIMVDKVPYIVVGVMPENFAKSVILTGRLLRPIDNFNRSGRVIGRIDGSLNQDEVQRYHYSLSRIMRQNKPGLEIKFASLQEEIIEPIASNLWLLMAGGLALLLVAVLNVTNLIFAHFNNRLQEFAMRVSLGATKIRLMRQLTVENVILAFIAGLGSILLAAWLLDLSLILMPETLPRREEINMDLSTWLFSLALALVGGFITSLIPASRVVNPNRLIDNVKQAGGRTAGSFGNMRLRRVLISIEVGFALVLVVAVALILRSYLKLVDQDLGFNPDRVVTGHIWAKYYGDDKRSDYFTDILTEIQNLPEVQRAAATSSLPIGPVATKVDFTVAYSVRGQVDLPESRQQRAHIRTVSDDYFSVLEIPVLAGRSFDDREQGAKTPSIILNDFLAKRIWPNESPIGKEIHFTEWGPEARFNVVGVVDNNYFDGLDSAIKSELFISMSQYAFGGSTFIAKLKTDNEQQALMAMSKVALRVDSSLPMIQLHSFPDLISKSTARQRVILWILLGFATTTVLLSGVGIYGLSNYLIGQRTSEIALRMAVGAKPGDIRYWVLKDSLMPVIWGIGLGLIVTLFSARLIASLLFGINVFDWPAYTGAIVVILLVGLLAPVAPALQASRVQPSGILHHQ